MPLDPVWEKTFASRPWGRYPNEEMVRFLARTFRDEVEKSNVSVLEVGCGTGANLWAVAKEGYRAHGIDGSPTAIRIASERARAEHVDFKLTCGDLTQPDTYKLGIQFHAVIDLACIQCNRILEAQRIVDCSRDILVPDGKMFSMLVADDCVGVGRGRAVEPGTFEDIEFGPLAGAGLNHFYTIAEVRHLFRDFQDVSIESIARTYNNREWTWKSWLVTAKK